VKPAELVRGIGLFDATALVVGSMIGSGIFIVSADSARVLGSTGWLLAAWAIAGVMTMTAALSCSELAAMLPKAGGQYVFFREAYGPLAGFLFGWAMILVIQTGTIAAVSMAFSKFLGVLWPAISSTRSLVPLPLSRGFISLTAGQAVALGVIAILTATNALLKYVISVDILFYVMLVLAVIVLRRRRPEWTRPFRAPGYPALPLLYAAAGILLIAILLRGNPRETWPGYALVASGTPVYLLWRRRL
jgi:basic amino acid/polyamine antiporter, APA family